MTRPRGEHEARGVAAGAIAALAVALLTPLTSEAQTPSGLRETTYGKRRGFESPQHFAVELRFSPFTPDVDSDPSLHGATPFRDRFGTNPRLLFGAELDWQVVRIPHVGTLGPGVGGGYSTMSRPAPFAPPRTGTSGEDTSFEVFPFYGVAVLRVDVLWRDLGVPFVPYAKMGLAYSLWRSSNTLGTSAYTSASSGQRILGEGHTVGTELAFGLGFNLNALDPYAARNFDDAMGVNGSYLFAEWTRSDLNGLFQQNALPVGGTYWTFGLAFEF
ncbi:MAG: MXAN_2562 family outer membrane beta-barrel protein [Myxococcota bacterium]|nr:MXAN_2562 family outer membrane beta-barrel protein [Myxococcota bacterium]